MPHVGETVFGIEDDQLPNDVIYAVTESHRLRTEAGIYNQIATEEGLLYFIPVLEDNVSKSP